MSDRLFTLDQRWARVAMMGVAATLLVTFPLGGNDRLSAGAGNDPLLGGAGDGTLAGGPVPMSRTGEKAPIRPAMRRPQPG